MAKFVRIDQIESGNGYFLLNLDLVATAHVVGTRGMAALAAAVNGQNDHMPPRGKIKLRSAEQAMLAEFTLESVDDAKRWVREHLGVDL